MVSSKDLTFVVQGYYDLNITNVVVESIREFFPDSEIIISTWNGIFVNDVSVDKVIHNNDPGSHFCDFGKTYLNLNRQLVSSRNGILNASRDFIIKIRSDLKFTSSSIINLINRSLYEFNNYNLEFKILESRVLVADVTSVNPRLSKEMPYHICDWFYFGKREDIISLFALPNFNENEIANWFKNGNYPKNNHRITFTRFAPEQLLSFSYILTKFDFKFDHSYDISNGNILNSEMLIVNNFIIFSLHDLGLFSLKHKEFPRYVRSQMYSFKDWKFLYNKLVLKKPFSFNVSFISLIDSIIIKCRIIFFRFRCFIKKELCETRT